MAGNGAYEVKKNKPKPNKQLKKVNIEILRKQTLRQSNATIKCILLFLFVIGVLEIDAIIRILIQKALLPNLPFR